MIAAAPRIEGNPKALFDLAIRYRTHGLLAEAVAALRRVAQIDPNNLGVELNIGYFLIEDGDFVAAAGEFEQLRRRYPEVPQALYGLALSLHRQRRFQEAIPLWRQFVAVAPNDAFAPRAQRFLLEALQSVEEGAG